MCRIGAESLEGRRGGLKEKLNQDLGLSKAGPGVSADASHVCQVYAKVDVLRSMTVLFSLTALPIP